MVAPILLMALWFVPAACVLLALALRPGGSMRWGYALAAFAAYAIYSFAGYATLPANAEALPAEVRAVSRAVQLALVLGMAALAIRFAHDRHVTREGMGLVAGRAGPVWLIAATLVGVTLLGALIGGIEPADWTGIGGLVYQMTLPGLEEEIIYRGLLASLFAAAVGGESALAWGTALGTMVSALGHGFTLEAGSITFNPVMLALLAAIGIPFSILRLRSGSILFPALGHNLFGAALRYL